MVSLKLCLNLWEFNLLLELFVKANHDLLHFSRFLDEPGGGVTSNVGDKGCRFDV